MSMNFPNGMYRRVSLADLGLGIDWNALTDGASETDPAAETTMTGGEGTGGMTGDEGGGAVPQE